MRGSAAYFKTTSPLSATRALRQKYAQIDNETSTEQQQIALKESAIEALAKEIQEMQKIRHEEIKVKAALVAIIQEHKGKVATKQQKSEGLVSTCEQRKLEVMDLSNPLNDVEAIQERLQMTIHEGATYLQFLKARGRQLRQQAVDLSDIYVGDDFSGGNVCELLRQRIEAQANRPAIEDMPAEDVVLLLMEMRNKCCDRLAAKIDQQLEKYNALCRIPTLQPMQDVSEGPSQLKDQLKQMEPLLAFAADAETDVGPFRGELDDLCTVIKDITASMETLKDCDLQCSGTLASAEHQLKEAVKKMPYCKRYLIFLDHVKQTLLAINALEDNDAELPKIDTTDLDLAVQELQALDSSDPEQHALTVMFLERFQTTKEKTLACCVSLSTSVMDFRKLQQETSASHEERQAVQAKLQECQNACQASKDRNNQLEQFLSQLVKQTARMQEACPTTAEDLATLRPCDVPAELQPFMTAISDGDDSVMSPEEELLVQTMQEEEEKFQAQLLELDLQIKELEDSRRAELLEAQMRVEWLEAVSQRDAQSGHAFSLPDLGLQAPPKLVDEMNVDELDFSHIRLPSEQPPVASRVHQVDTGRIAMTVDYTPELHVAKPPVAPLTYESTKNPFKCRNSQR